jgi:TetR/AcrR family transcriptional regulator, transcriptional repressor for nem operon
MQAQVQAERSEHTRDHREALDKAMLLFWKKGYNDTSIDNLVSFTGVSRYGLYGTFGSKHDLFLASLDNYRDRIVPKQLERLETPGASWHDIRLFFEGFITMAQTPEGKLGYLMCNTSTEEAIGQEIVNWLESVVE